MRVEELKFKEQVADTIQNEISDIIARAGCLDDLLRGWLVDKERGASLYRGIDDDDPNKLSVCVVLEITSREVADLYFADSEVVPQGNDVLTIGRFITGVKASSGRITFNEDKLDAWEQSLGFEYNDFLCEELGPWDALVPFSLAYVLSEGGEVRISTPDKRIFENYLDDHDVIDTDALVCIDAHYQAPRKVGGVIPGFGICKYVWRSSNGVGLGKQAG